MVMIIETFNSVLIERKIVNYYAKFGFTGIYLHGEKKRRPTFPFQTAPIIMLSEYLKTNFPPEAVCQRVNSEHHTYFPNSNT